MFSPCCFHLILNTDLNIHQIHIEQNILKTILILIALLVLTHSSVAFSKDPWPGLPPDCWQEPRNYHNGSNSKNWKPHIAFEHVPLQEFSEKVFSPNKGYYFVKKGWRGKAALYIYSEKDYLIKVSLNKLHGIKQKWINEKLLFIQPWWGRIAATDIIYDVENEKIVYIEDLTDGHIAFDQFQKSCAQLGGCQCIKTPKK